MKQIFSKSEEEIIKKITEITNVQSLTENEILRARMMQRLFVSYGIKDTIIDPECNVISTIKGSKTPENIIMIGAGLDTDFLTEEPIISLKTMTARGVSDALALYSLAFLGEMLKKEKLNNTVLLVCTSNSKSRRLGINYILNSINKKIKGYINLQGIGLGEVKSRAIGEVKLKILFRNIETGSFLPTKEHNVVKALYQFLSKIFEEDFKESIEYKVEDIVYGKKNTEKYSNSAYVLINFRGISLDDLIESTNIIEDLAKGASLENNIQYSLIDFGEHKGAFLRDSLLEDIFIKECNELNIKASTKYTNSEISETLLKGIDSVTIGITEGKNYGEKDETIDIRSIYNGIIQLYKGVLKFDKS